MHQHKVCIQNISAYLKTTQFESESVSHSVVSDSLKPNGLPGSSVHGILQARILEWVAIPFSRGLFPTQGANPGFLHCRQILYCLSIREAQVKSSYCH